MESEACVSSSAPKKKTVKKRERPIEGSPESSNTYPNPSPGEPSSQPPTSPHGEAMEEEPIPRPAKIKSKSKSPRRVKGSNNLAEEDIIDGFSFLGFRALSDLEAHVQSTINHRKAKSCTLSKPLSLDRTSPLVTTRESSPPPAHQVALVSSLKTETAATCTPTSAILNARITPTIAETINRPPPSPPPIVSPVKPSHKSSAKKDGSVNKKKKILCDVDKVLPTLPIGDNEVKVNEEVKLASSLPTPPPSKSGSSFSGSCSSGSDCGSTASKDELDLHTTTPEVELDSVLVPPPPPPTIPAIPSLAPSSPGHCKPCAPVARSAPGTLPTGGRLSGAEESESELESSKASGALCPVSSDSGHSRIPALTPIASAVVASPVISLPTPPASNRSSPCTYQYQKKQNNNNHHRHHHHPHHNHHGSSPVAATPSSKPALTKSLPSSPAPLTGPSTSTVTSVPSSVTTTTTVTTSCYAPVITTNDKHHTSSSSSSSCSSSSSSILITATTTCTTASSIKSAASATAARHLPKLASPHHPSSTTTAVSRAAAAAGIHREPPKPIPGLSGTRNPLDDRKDLKPTPTNHDRSPSWHSSPGSRSSSSSLHHKSSPHHTGNSNPINSSSSSHPPPPSPHHHHHPHHPPPHHPHHQRPAPTSSAASSPHLPGPQSLHHPVAANHTAATAPHPSVGLAPPPPPTPTPHPMHSMYGPQLAPPPSGLISAALHAPYTQQEALAVTGNPDILSRAQHELNARFLQDRGLPPTGLPPHSQAAAAAAAAYSLHQHNHMHQHQHMHQHFGSLPGPLNLPGSSLLPPPPPSGAPHLKPPAAPSAHLVGGPPPHGLAQHDRQHQPKLDKLMGKFDSPFSRQSLIPGIPAGGFGGLPPMMHPSGLAAPLGSGMQGAFQPKVTGPSSSQLLMSLEQRKSAAAAAAAAAVPPSPNHGIKKPGKWCAAHVRVAWEIHLHQQKQQAESQRGGGEGKGPPTDPLRPPSHLFPGGNPLHRPGTSDLASASSLLGAPGAHSRSPFDASPQGHAASFLTPGGLGKARAGVPQFPRPAPYPNLGTLSNNAFGGLAGNIGSSPFGPRCDLPGLPGLNPAHEWNRLHRTPPSFPTPPTWPPKSELDREREASGRTSRDSRDASRDRERDLERERELFREKEKDREREMRDKERHRERSASRGSPNCLPRTPSRSHDFHKLDTRRDSERSRSRSRSPMRNGPLELARSNSSSSLSKSEGMYSGRSSSGEVRVKEERRDDVLVTDDARRHDPRLEKDMKSELHKNSGLMAPGYAGLFGNPMLDHRLFGLYPQHPSAIPPVDRLPPHPSRLWNPFDTANHRAEMERDREKEHILRRLGEDHIAREQQELLLRHQMMQDRERLALLEKERLSALESSKLAPPPLRPAIDHPSFLTSLYPPATSSHPYRASSSPHLNVNSKSNSPASSVGGPPPLISSTGGNRSHSNSPSLPVHKSKPPAPSSPLTASDTNSVMASEKNDIASTPNGHDVELQSR